MHSKTSVCQGFLFPSSLRLHKGRWRHSWEGRAYACGTGHRVRAGPCLAHGHQPALISFVSEAMDDEPGLLVCLEIGRLNR